MLPKFQRQNRWLLTVKLAEISSSQLLLQSGIKQQQHPTALTAPAPGKASCGDSTTLRNDCWHQTPSWPLFLTWILGTSTLPQAFSPNHSSVCTEHSSPPRHHSISFHVRAGKRRQQVRDPSDYAFHRSDKDFSSFSALCGKVYQLHLLPWTWDAFAFTSVFYFLSKSKVELHTMIRSISVQRKSVDLHPHSSALLGLVSAFLNGSSTLTGSVLCCILIEDYNLYTTNQAQNS